MAWNEPGGPRENDPWGRRPGNNKGGPPDLDEVFRKLRQQLGGLFGKNSGAGGGNGGTVPPEASGPIPTKVIGAIAAAIIIGWAATGIYTVDEGRRGVVLRFGEGVAVAMPGPHWHIPYPIETVEIIDMDQTRAVEVGYRSGESGAQGESLLNESLMLTQDENIVNVKFAVQYNVKDAKNYLFNVRDPDMTLRQATESAMREVVGKNNMDFVLGEGKSEVVARAKDIIQKMLDRYVTGLQVVSVNIQDTQAPEEVQGAFLDAIKAREDEQRLKNEAEAYANDVIPKARGAAARLIEEANGYKSRVIEQAKGDASRFQQILTEYEKAPKVTRDRLYIDAMESVYGRSSKVMIDAKGGNNLLYLPMDKLMQGRNNDSSDSASGDMKPMELVSPPLSGDTRLDPRSRDQTRSREQR